MPVLKRYLPLIGVAVLVADVILRALGMADLAATLMSIGGAVGAVQASPVGAAELAAAVAAGTGVVLKVIAEIKKAKQPQHIR